MRRGTAGLKSEKTMRLTEASSLRRKAREAESSDHQYPVSARSKISSQ
jgi:hypothetical protein